MRSDRLDWISPPERITGPGSACDSEIRTSQKCPSVTHSLTPSAQSRFWCRDPSHGESCAYSTQSRPGSDVPCPEPGQDRRDALRFARGFQVQFPLPRRVKRVQLQRTPNVPTAPVLDLRQTNRRQTVHPAGARDSGPERCRRSTQPSKCGLTAAIRKFTSKVQSVLVCWTVNRISIG